ncbi:NUDIX domain-containing protein [Candidatus Thorarchaeota archaeon]|nr:MAG: NUDIX domain-containing protein [Candidatus Thorarchaeota archaeon]
MRRKARTTRYKPGSSSWVYQMPIMQCKHPSSGIHYRILGDLILISRSYPDFPIPGVGAVVLGEKGVLLVRRVKEPGLGLWSVPGGAIEVGETQLDAVRREVKEETGVYCEIIRLIDTDDIIIQDSNGGVEYHYLLNHYLAVALTSDITPESEDAKVKWFNLNGLPLEEMPEKIIDLIKKIEIEELL